MSAGALDSSVTLEDVFTVLDARRVPVAPELAGYLVLEIAERADPAGGDIDPRAVFVGEEGTVALVKPKRGGAGGDAEMSIRAVLARLLEASGSQTPALTAASKRKSGAGLSVLAEELETALVPVNRAAGRRALARLAREVRRILLGVGRNALPWSNEAAPVRRSVSPGQGSSTEPQRPEVHNPGFAHDEDSTTARRAIPSELLDRATAAEGTELPTTQLEPEARAPSPSQLDVDALIDQFAVSASGDQQHATALKEIAGLEPTPRPASARARPEARQGPLRGQEAESDSVESLLALGPEPLGQAAGVPGPTRHSSPSSRVRGADDVIREDARQVPTQPSQLRRSRASLPSTPRLEPKRASRLWPLFAIAAIAAGAYAVRLLRPSATSRGGPEPSAPTAASQARLQSLPPCIGTLLVTGVPLHAEVLLREGQAPVDVERMPVGARLEFVATAEGFAPKRVVIPGGAGWDTGQDGKPRFEAAVQLDRSSIKSNADSWPAGEPGSAVGGQGPPGTVHVVATPRGAEVWMLAGIGPEARVESLRCDRDLDVLIAGPTTFRKRLHVGAGDFQPEDIPAGRTAAPTRIARVSAK
ncbi:MAG TPA: hypothetical protein VGY54_06140 [Polyangiaceae bacterium]|nr:hypothetical protein [Polyangiaceae bacterium]